MAEVTRTDWAKAFMAAEQELIAEGYTCDDLCPMGTLKDGSGKKCIACMISIKLRQRLLGDEA